MPAASYQTTQGRMLRDLAEVAERDGVTMRHGFESFEERLVAMVQRGYWWSWPEVRTINEKGQNEHDPKKVNMRGNQALTTYAGLTSQKISKTDVLANGLRDTPYMYGLQDDNTFDGLLQIWSLNYNASYKDKKKCLINLDMDDPAFARNVEQKERELQTMHPGLKNSLAEEVKVRGTHFKDAVEKILVGSQVNPIRYCLLHTICDHPVFIGDVVSLMKLIDRPWVQEFMKIKEFDVDKKTITVLCEDAKGKPKPDITFFMNVPGQQYVLYRRQGYTSFTCIKLRWQFEDEGCLFEPEPSGTVDEFVSQATFQHDLGKGAFGFVKKYMWGGRAYGVKEYHKRGDQIGPHTDTVKEFKVYQTIKGHRYPHPCLIQVYLLEEYTRLVFECGERDLGNQLRDFPPADSLALAWLAHVFKGVEFLHKLNVIHRDLNPRNVIIVNKYSLLYAKLADFGQSKHGRKALDSVMQPTTGGGPAGSSGYMAPELLNIDTKSAHNYKADWYSLGAIIFKVRGREDPPGADTGYDPSLGMKGNIERHQQDQTKLHCRIQDKAADPSSWQHLVLQLTERDQDKRPRSADIREHPALSSTILRVEKEFEKELTLCEVALRMPDWMANLSDEQRENLEKFLAQAVEHYGTSDERAVRDAMYEFSSLTETQVKEARAYFVQFPPKDNGQILAALPEGEETAPDNGSGLSVPKDEDLDAPTAEVR